MIKKAALPICIFLLVLLIDQLTKFYALHNFIQGYKVNNYLYFDLALNRGISWSFFDFQNNYIFILISILIFLILLIFTYYTFVRFKNNQNIIPETLVISGGASNLIDRIIHFGVIDFISLSYKNLHWPLFNFADMFIVFGVFIMLIKNFKE
jgi:signal peptidase II